MAKKFDEVLSEIAEAYNGEHAKVIPAVTKALYDDEALLAEFVDRYVPVAIQSVCHRHSSKRRQIGKKAISRGVEPVKSMFGMGREEHVERTRKHEEKWLNSVRYWTLFCGKFLKDATVADVEQSIVMRRDHLMKTVRGTEETIAYETAVLELARREGAVTIINVIRAENAKYLKQMAEAA